ncbi:MAG: N-acetylmuramoyl-L-alanine amidase [Sporomusaceae bacterium]|nr:N-acetylmuramoyl-L-alanine amidase [Sporomusaceae bacterium]
MRIFINPGHAPDGTPDPGAVNAVTGLRECDVALAVGEGVATYLRAADCEVTVLQLDDLSAIVMAANDWQADFFISIHCNSAESTAATGTEVWYCSGSLAGEQLGDCIKREILATLPLVDRGMKEATPGENGLYVLTNTAMPACLVELAFISNQQDEVLLREAQQQDAFARAIARGVTDCDIYHGQR